MPIHESIACEQRIQCIMNNIGFTLITTFQSKKVQMARFLKGSFLDLICMNRTFLFSFRENYILPTLLLDIQIMMSFQRLFTSIDIRPVFYLCSDRWVSDYSGCFPF
mmetsp:Transcript_3721/g.8500  ORF Transcript_3721/g.8500 Transcript_3721/m.8500 type:complete len:107 (-) Transcript_3721:270-590(-)